MYTVQQRYRALLYNHPLGLFLCDIIAKGILRPETDKSSRATVRVKLVIYLVNIISFCSQGRAAVLREKLRTRNVRVDSVCGRWPLGILLRMPRVTRITGRTVDTRNTRYRRTTCRRADRISKTQATRQQLCTKRQDSLWYLHGFRTTSMEVKGTPASSTERSSSLRANETGHDGLKLEI